MKPIHEIEIDGKKHFVKIGLFGKVREVYPIFKNTDEGWKKGNINWKNLLMGSLSNLISLLIYVGIAAAIYFSLKDIFNQCQDVLRNPCPYCNQLMANITNSFLP